MSYDAFDQIETRCPQLGGEVTFGYCRVLDDGLPCPKALTCFDLKFPVVAYFERILTKQTFERVFLSAPAGRLEQILVAASAARARDREQS